MIHYSDELLSGVDYQELIATIVCNIPSNKITSDTVRKEAKKIFKMAIEDAEYRLNQNLHTVTKECKRQASF